MAKVANNIFVRGLTGTVGDQFVIRKTRSGKTIVANIPSFDENREFTETQKNHQEAFRQATTYAKSAKNQEVYINKAKGTGATAYNMAVADWFIVPQVLDIDISKWNGQIGETIYVRAKDDTKVTSVHLFFRNGETIFEEGDAVQSDTDGLLWTYTTQTVVPDTAPIFLAVTARDLPGNIGAQTEQLR
jgi:hypothetical protein